jgi:hypothetical protein
VPCKEPLLRGRASDAEDLDRFICERRSQRRRCDARGVQGEGRDVDDVTVVVAEWSIRAEQLSNATSWYPERYLGLSQRVESFSTSPW